MSVNSDARPEVLVSVEWLGGRLGDPRIRIVEVDEDTSAYDRSHIPGSLGWNWTTDLHAPVQRDYLSKEALEGLLCRSGVGPDTTVVLYGGNNNWFAAYAYWICKLRGFDNVKLLDGGRKKWEAGGCLMTDAVADVSPARISIHRAERPEIRAFRDEVLASLGTCCRYVDVRSPDEYKGLKVAPDHLPQEQAQVPGHIPGAVNVPWAEAVDADGTFKPAPALRELYAAAGVDGTGPVIAYCRIGERSSHTWFALTELLGYADVKNYDGSWTEYGSLVGVPVAKSA